MKKIMYFAAALLVLAGCQSSQEARENAPAEVSTITGTIELPQEPNKIIAPEGWQTTAKGEKFKMQWENTDRIYIYKGSECHELTLKSIDETTGKATFEGVALTDMSSYSVAYGYDPISTATAKTFTVPYVAGNYRPFADGTGTNYNFTVNQFGPVLGLKLKGTDALSKIVVVLSDANNTLATYTMTPENALQLDATTAINVYFPIKSITGATTMSISFYKTENETDVLIMTKTTTNITQVAANKVTTFAELTVADPYNGHAYVDLGLPSGLKWATCNVGATSSEQYGDYFAWGETEPYYTGLNVDGSATGWKTGKSSGYASNWSSYFDAKLVNGVLSGFNKYYNEEGGKTVLESTDDAARQNWGGAWRMPTAEEFQELLNNCNNSWTTQGGVSGYKFTSKTNSANYIFLPAAGDFGGTSRSDAGSIGYYWSSSLSASNSNYGRILYFNSGSVSMSYDRRYYGQSVRPVCQ